MLRISIVCVYDQQCDLSTTFIRFERFLQVCYFVRMKSHEKRYNDISRLSFNVTACIWIQLHLVGFRKNRHKTRIYVILWTGLWLRLLLAISISFFSFAVTIRLRIINGNNPGIYSHPRLYDVLLNDIKDIIAVFIIHILKCITTMHYFKSRTRTT